jgi:hypothetical protein
MLGEGDDIEFDFATTGSDLAQVLGAVYAVERLDHVHRPAIVTVLQRATHWHGPIGPALVAHLAGSRSAELSALADPRTWALQVLGFPAEVREPSPRDVSKHYRARMRDVHPDHGGDRHQASKAILDLNEARRILTGKVA